MTYIDFVCQPGAVFTHKTVGYYRNLLNLPYLLEATMDLFLFTQDKERLDRRTSSSKRTNVAYSRMMEKICQYHVTQVLKSLLVF